MTWKRLIGWSVVTALCTYGFFDRVSEYQETGMLYLANTEGKLYLAGTAAETSLFALFIVLVVLVSGLALELRKKLRGHGSTRSNMK